LRQSHSLLRHSRSLVRHSRSLLRHSCSLLRHSKCQHLRLAHQQQPPQPLALQKVGLLVQVGAGGRAARAHQAPLVQQLQETPVQKLQKLQLPP
jgi:hypothetical protein